MSTLRVKYKVPVIITSLGAQEELNKAIHSYGGIVLHDVINQKFARKAIEKGADGLILVAASWRPCRRSVAFALVQETREWFDGPIALSGSIATGDAVLRPRRWARFRLYRLRLYRDEGSERWRGLQAGDRRQRR